MTLKGMIITAIQLLVIAGIQNIIGGNVTSFTLSVALLATWTANSKEK